MCSLVYTCACLPLYVYLCVCGSCISVRVFLCMYTCTRDGSHIVVAHVTHQAWTDRAVCVYLCSLRRSTVLVAHPVRVSRLARDINVNVSVAHCCVVSSGPVLSLQHSRPRHRMCVVCVPCTVNAHQWGLPPRIPVGVLGGHQSHYNSGHIKAAYQAHQNATGTQRRGVLALHAQQCCNTWA